MEELGFTIAVPETLLCGFVIMVILAIIVLVILFRTLKILRTVDEMYDYIEDINERQKRIESIVDRMSLK